MTWVFMRTVGGLVQVDVIYRRVDDLFLDPEVFRSDSTLGVAGLMRAWRAGHVGLANVPTFLCSDYSQRSHVLAHLDELVVKPANESGGYGVFIGPHATGAQRDEVARRILAEPRNYIAQPTLELSTGPTICDGKIAPRHLDLRPFILSGPNPYVTQGGLTRVALTEGSLVVNSSQGGGSKDTWILDPDVIELRQTTERSERNPT